METINNNLIVCRTDHNHHFKIIDTTCIEDRTLSWKAKAIHNYLITRPENWEINTKDLEQRSIDGQSSLRSGIKELINAGYLFRTVKRNPLKQIEKWGYFSTEIPQSLEYVCKIIQGSEWEIYDKPIDQELECENLQVENLQVENHTLNNKNRVNNHQNSISSQNEDTKVSSGTSKKEVPSRSLNQEFLCLKENENLYKDCEDVFDYWIQFGFPFVTPDKDLDDPTDTLQDAFILISKEFKRKSTKEEIKAAIYLYYEFLCSPDKYFLRNEDTLQVKDIVNFFEFDRVKKAKQRNRKDTDPFKTIRSWYWECATALVKGEQYLIDKYGRKTAERKPYEEPVIEDKYPLVTERFKILWKQQMAKDKWFKNGGGNKDENCFRRASVLAVDMMNKYQDDVERLPHRGNWINTTWAHIPENWAHEFVESIVWSISDKYEDDAIDITPAWLCGPKQEDRLVKYLRDQGVMSNPNDDGY